MCTSLQQVHVAIDGIEKVIPRAQGPTVFLKLPALAAKQGVTDEGVAEIVNAGSRMAAAGDPAQM